MVSIDAETESVLANAEVRFGLRAQGKLGKVREAMYVAYLRDHEITVEQVEEHWRSKGYAVPN